MSTPVLHLLAGCNGAGKSTLAEEVLLPLTHLPFVNADRIAADLWPGDLEQQRDAASVVSQLAADERDRLMGERASFVTETVFSHPSKLELITRAKDLGYTVWLYVVMIEENLAVARVADRVEAGGHTVPEDKIRSRYRRLWALVAQARELADRSDFYDNSSLDDPLAKVSSYRYGQAVGTPRWPTWTPPDLTA